MKQNRILLTGFKNSSAEILFNKIYAPYEKFLFTNDYTTIISEIDKLFLRKKYDYVIMFGQKPLIKSLAIEIICKQKKNHLETNFEVEKLMHILDENHIAYKLSRNPGTSYCNFAYYNVLKSIEKRGFKTKVIFIHVPYKDNFLELEKLVNIMNQ